MHRIFSSLVCTDYCSEYTICISNDNNVFSFGTSDSGRHGHIEENISIPTQIQRLTNIKQISCGEYHTICLDYDGNAFTFGKNDKGQLGIANIKFTHVPQKLDLVLIQQASCGDYFTICLNDNGELFSFGDNSYGQLALGNYNSSRKPQLIPNISNVEFVECGGLHTICKTFNEEYYSWGNNNSGQLGNEVGSKSNIPIQCNNWPNNIIDIKSGGSSSLLLTSEGLVYVIGNNNFGQLGLNDKNISSVKTPTIIENIPEIQRIESGYHHCLCIDINNDLWVFGGNYNGQLGLGKSNRYEYKPIKHPSLSNIIDISSGGDHTFVKTSDNEIYAFGKNNNLQLGIKKTKSTNQTKPIRVLEGKEDIWNTRLYRSKQKSARK